MLTPGLIIDRGARMQAMKDSLVRTGNADNLKSVEFENLSMAVKTINFFWQLGELPEVS